MMEADEVQRKDCGVAAWLSDHAQCNATSWGLSLFLWRVGTARVLWKAIRPTVPETCMTH